MFFLFFVFYTFKMGKEMNKDAQMKNPEEQKEKIRNRYKGIDFDELQIIPAKPHQNFYEDQSTKRVAVYARVSTDDPRQTSSYELQKNHYMDFIGRYKSWQLVDIYADEGISGTSLKRRNAFIRMIKDCEAGKIDLILTKSVSRFARNVVDCIKTSRELRQLKPPVGILFEIENINTLDPESEMHLIYMASNAQEESHIKSRLMNTSIDMRFRRGIFLTPSLLGYDKDEDGNLVINKEEAKIVRLVFYMYLYGYSCRQIAETLTRLSRKTKKGNTVWSEGAILPILQNERHCGDVLARKTWTPNYLDHKSKKNIGDKEQIYRENNHEAIVSRDDFIAVQRLISNAKYGHKGFLPELKVVQEGVLAGFVSINPRWAGFKAEDYQEASDSVYPFNEDGEENIEIEAQSGDFDLRNFEVARSQFFDTTNKICVTFSSKNIQFSTECVRKFEKTTNVEMLVNPNERLFAVRPGSQETRNSVQWSNIYNNLHCPRNIGCAAYIKTLYELFGWNPEYKYRVRGIRRQKDDEILIIFNMNETEIFISQNEIISEEDSSDKQLPKDLMPFTNGPNKDIIAYPPTWANTFGNDYYSQSHAKELALLNEESEWKAKAEGEPYIEPDLEVTNPDEIELNIQNIMNDMQNDMQQEVINDGE
jgi:DNA invertase Pin-like site-specific DNA recombinase